MFMATQGKGELTTHPKEGQLTLPILVANNHVLFLNKKASSSGAVKPPMAEDLLEYYTAEQLRAHFLGLGLGIKSVSFQPKPLNPAAGEKDADPVQKEESCCQMSLTGWRVPASTQRKSTAMASFPKGWWMRMCCRRPRRRF